MSLLEALVICFLFVDTGILIGAYYTEHLKAYAVCEVLGSLVAIIYGIICSLVGFIVVGAPLLVWGIFCTYVAWSK